MMIRRRTLLTSLLVALPAAAVLTWAADRLRTRDLQLAVERVVTSQLNEATRERCETDPVWFFTGPMEGRPSFGLFVPASPEDLEPRPNRDAQPFELFGYNERFVGSGPATPRFPEELRAPMLRLEETAAAPYVTADGTGVQFVLDTAWLGSNCRFLLGRFAPPPDQTSRRVWTFLAVFGAVAAMALLAGVPTVVRIRRLAHHAREAVSDGYRSMAPERLKDELSSLVFVFNDAVTELQRRQGRIEDLDTSLRRFVETVDREITPAIDTLEAKLGDAAASPDRDRTAMQALVVDTHGLALHVDTLTAANRLRLAGRTADAGRIDLGALVARVVDRHRPFAEVRQVTIELDVREGPIAIAADDALMACAVANVVDNAVRYNAAGGKVRVTVAGAEGGQRFRLFVADDGPGVSDEHFRGLTAVRRFRGDEHRNRRPDSPGLGLAVAQEVCDRFGFTLDLKRPSTGGFEVEFSGSQA